ncbi:MAG: OmpA family protein [Desulfovibrio sp.]|jgi:OOP family OmpA-OmpF porin|nr:OmpA family protein [Desulfovibrio sp.]
MTADSTTEPEGSAGMSNDGAAVSAGTAFWGEIPEKPTDLEIVRLRDLLFRREIVLLERLRELQDDQRYNARKTSEVLAEAIQLRAGKDPLVELALEPVVDDVVRTLLRKRRGDFVDSLFPLMGPSIRKSIAETFRSMLGSFSKSMEMAFSWKGLRWRFEAMRSGKPFSEIVMLNTLVYRVEQIFFTHGETGIPLAHVASDEAYAQDAEMVSSMFTAIQDFVRSCFAGGSEEDLESLQLGEYTIIIEKKSQAYLACVVRGTPPVAFREQLRATLDFLLLEHADALAEFSGDTAPFAGAAPYLVDCLSSQYADGDKKIPWWGKALPVFLTLALACGLGYCSYQEKLSVRLRQALVEERKAFREKMESALNILRAEPGLLVTNVASGQDAPWEATVLKDAFADTPENVLQERGFDPKLFSFKSIPYISHDPAIVARRAKTDIKLPSTVTMHFDGKGTLSFKGTASMGWIVKARDEARSLPGVERVDISGLRDPMTDRISALIKKVESTVVEFPIGRDTPVPRDEPKLQKAVDSLVELEKIVQDMGFTVSLTIYGHADATGTEKRNYEISQARTRTVAAMLYARGSAMPIAMYGMGAGYPKDGKSADPAQNSDRGDQASRRVELRVHVMRSAAASPESLLLSQP